MPRSQFQPMPVDRLLTTATRDRVSKAEVLLEVGAIFDAWCDRPRDEVCYRTVFAIHSPLVEEASLELETVFMAAALADIGRFVLPPPWTFPSDASVAHIIQRARRRAKELLGRADPDGEPWERSLIQRLKRDPRRTSLESGGRLSLLNVSEQEVDRLCAVIGPTLAARDDSPGLPELGRILRPRLTPWLDAGAACHAA